MPRFSSMGVHLHVTLPSSSGPLERFLRAYFEPYFTISDQPAGAATTTGAANLEPEAPLARLELRTDSPPMESARFTHLDSQDIDRSKAFLRCTGQIFDHGSVRWVRMSPSEAIVRIDRDQAHITVWAVDEERLRVPALRVIEDVVLGEVQRRGGVVIHASAVVTQAGAVLFVGNKGAGKTSSLCRGLSAFAADKLANDNVVLLRRGSGIVAHGWPAFFKVEVGTVAATLALARDFPAAHRPLLHDDRALWDIYWKVALYPGQGAERFGARIVPQAPIAAIVFPRFSERAVPGLQPVSLDSARESLLEALQGVHNPNHPEWMDCNPVPVDQPARELATMLPDLADIGCYRLDWAPSLDDLMGRIPALRQARRSLRSCAEGETPEDGWPPLPE